MNRGLAVWLNHLLVGHLREENSIWSFQYSPAWRRGEGRFGLSPALSLQSDWIIDGSSVRAVQWFFDNLLPEEGARVLLSREANIRDADSFSLLEYYGAESAGALTLLPEGKTPDGGGEPRRLTDEELAARIKQLPRISLSKDSPKKMSLAGAQHKLPVIWHPVERELYEPTAQGLSSHILKPDHTDADSYPHSVVNEWFCMQWAAVMGLSVPAVDIHFVPDPVYLVIRFDRQWLPQRDIERKHVIDSCQLLNLSGSYKYREASVDRLVEIIGLCRKKARAREQLFKWFIFNALIGNGDAHLKNISFFPGEGGIELAPFYDLLSTAVYDGENWGQQTMSYEAAGKKTFAELDRQSVLAVGGMLGLSEKISAQYLDEMRNKIEGSFSKLYEQFENLEIPAQCGPMKAGGLRLLRQIQHLILRPMISQLA